MKMGIDDEADRLRRHRLDFGQDQLGADRVVRVDLDHVVIHQDPAVVACPEPWIALVKIDARGDLLRCVDLGPGRPQQGEQPCCSEEGRQDSWHRGKLCAPGSPVKPGAADPAIRS